MPTTWDANARALFSGSKLQQHEVCPCESRVAQVCILVCSAWNLVCSAWRLHPGAQASSATRLAACCMCAESMNCVMKETCRQDDRNRHILINNAVNCYHALGSGHWAGTTEFAQSLGTECMAHVVSAEKQLHAEGFTLMDFILSDLLQKMFLRTSRLETQARSSQPGRSSLRGGGPGGNASTVDYSQNTSILNRHNLAGKVF